MGSFFDCLAVPRYTVIYLLFIYFKEITINFASLFCREEKYVALKVVKSAQHYTETATDEIRLLEVIRENSPKHAYSEKIVRLLNHFTVRGVNGIHTCLVFEALGCSLYKLIVKSNYQGLALPQVKSIIRQVRFEFHYNISTKWTKQIVFFFSLKGFARITLSAYKMSHHSHRH